MRRIPLPDDPHLHRGNPPALLHELAIIASHPTRIGPEPLDFRDEVAAQLEERLAESRRRKQS